MTESLEQAPAPVSTPAADGAPEAPRSRRSGVVMAAILVPALVAATVFWLHRSQQALLGAAESERAALEAQLAALGAKLDESAKSRGAMQGEFAALMARTDALAAVVARLDQRAQTAERDATLADVEELIVGAAERLRLGGEVGAAVAAVEAADRRVGELGEPALLPLREHLRRDLENLRAVPVPDTTGIALTFADYANRIEELPIKAVDFEPADAPSAATPTAGGWRGVVERIWHDLVQLVDVERIPTPDLLLTDPQLRRLLIENVRMELAAARYATLRHDAANMRASAGAARKLINQYFDRDAPAVAAMLDGLAGVQQVDLAPPLPTLDAAVEAIRALRTEPLLEPARAP